MTWVVTSFHLKSVHSSSSLRFLLCETSAKVSHRVIGSISPSMYNWILKAVSSFRKIQLLMTCSRVYSSSAKTRAGGGGQGEVCSPSFIFHRMILRFYCCGDSPRSAFLLKLTTLMRTKGQKTAMHTHGYILERSLGVCGSPGPQQSDHCLI